MYIHIATGRLRARCARVKHDDPPKMLIPESSRVARALLRSAVCLLITPARSPGSYTTVLMKSAAQPLEFYGVSLIARGLEGL